MEYFYEKLIRMGFFDDKYTFEIFEPYKIFSKMLTVSQ